MASRIVYIAISLLLVSCSTPYSKEPSPPRVHILLTSTTFHVPSPTDTRFPTDTPFMRASPISQPSVTSTVSSTVTPSPEPTITITPTYSILRGKVLVQSNCRYGPGAMYLYKYGLYPETVLEIIGRTDAGNWVLIRAIGGTNPCWVKASLLDIRGDVLTVQPTYIPLPQSPYYGSVTGVTARRDGYEVTISWNLFVSNLGDDHSSPTQLVETWVCRDGQLVFTPIGTYDSIITVIDEPGCIEPSHGRVYGVEKHGYTFPVEIPWPVYGEP